MFKTCARVAALAAGVAGAMAFGAGAANAGEGLFSRVYTTDTEPAGQFELEQLVRFREGRAFGYYGSTDFRTELEYGVTDNFQVAVYFNSVLTNAHNAPDDDDPNGATGFTRNAFNAQSVSAEFIYRVLSPYKDGIGLAFYLEPEYDFHDLHNGLSYDGTWELEGRILLQKNFFDDRLIIAYNLILETEHVRFKDADDSASELDWNNEIGITYRFAENWFAGLEARNHNEYGHTTDFEHSVYWAGPVIHYGGERFWATLGWLRQVAGNPGYDEDGNYIGGDLFLRSHERNEVTLKVGVPL